MRNLLILFILLFSINISAQRTEEIAVKVVQEQLDAYNAKDIDAFMNVFSTDAAIYNFGNEKALAKGAEEVRAVYTKLFINSPNLHSLVINRSVIGNKVIDYELISGRQNSDELLKLIAIYEVEDGLIIKATFLRE